ncbi:unnamed protein product [Arabidopsis thaliana]|uniref:Methyltransferase type 11 domain-containing protein n=1 Tax=Arabidopsis thaliana TaxID=3702 RepID=A0A5S9XW88_ARATH|nr:unnamed protein product [Arabidopsis thaliana]
MERNVEKMLNRVSVVFLSIGTVLMVIMILQTPKLVFHQKLHRNLIRIFRDLHAIHRLVSIFFSQRRTLESDSLELGNRVYPPTLPTSSDFAISDSFKITPKLSVFPPEQAMLRWLFLRSDYPTLPQVDPHNLPFFDRVFDFVFTAHLAEALFPWRFVEEMERTVRCGGFCVVAVDECSGDDVRDIARFFHNSKVVDVANVTLERAKRTRAKRTSILFKLQDSKRASILFKVLSGFSDCFNVHGVELTLS